MVEWIAHHLTVGFDRIVIYDHGSTDDTPRIIQACATLEPRVVLRSWQEPSGQSPQVSAYADALAYADTDWIGFFDTDKMLVLHQHESVNDFLAEAAEQVGAIAVKQLLFGSSGEQYYRDEPVSQRFRQCAAEQWPKNLIFKTIARVGDVEAICHPHSARLRAGKQYTSGLLEPTSIADGAKTAQAYHQLGQPNHYVQRPVKSMSRSACGAAPIYRMGTNRSMQDLIRGFGRYACRKDTRVLAIFHSRYLLHHTSQLRGPDSAEEREFTVSSRRS